MRHPRLVIMVFFALVGACVSVTGQSAEPPCTEDEPGDTRCNDAKIELTPITVTATRRESLVERVPVSVTVLSGQKYVIRGVSTGVFAESRAATAVYLDETPVTDGGFGGLSYSPDPMLVNINRVEVLRGPQGTL